VDAPHLINGGKKPIRQADSLVLSCGHPHTHCRACCAPLCSWSSFALEEGDLLFGQRKNICSQSQLKGGPGAFAACCSVRIVSLGSWVGTRSAHPWTRIASPRQGSAPRAAARTRRNHAAPRASRSVCAAACRACRARARRAAGPRRSRSPPVYALASAARQRLPRARRHLAHPRAGICRCPGSTSMRGALDIGRDVLRRGAAPRWGNKINTSGPALFRNVD